MARVEAQNPQMSDAGVTYTAPILSGQAWQQAADCLRVLAHPVRLQMVQFLLQGKFTVGEVAAHCQIAPSMASEHLRLMQRCGFLDSVRESRRVFYHVVEPQLANIMRCIESKFDDSSQPAAVNN